MNKKVKYTIIVLLLVVLSIIGIFYTHKFIEKKNEEKKEIKLLTTIQNSYHELVETTKQKTIYKKENNKYIKVGIVSKNTILTLDEHNIKTTSDIYFPIKDTNYYIDYKNLKEAKEKEIDTSLDNYLVTKKITTNPTILHQDDEIVFTLNEEYTFDILAVNENNYYVKYLNDIYTVKDNFELKDKEVTEPLLNKISVLNFSDNITTTKLEEILKHLSSENYRTISITDFKLWITGSVNLPEKSILLLSYKELSAENKKVVDTYKMNINTDLETISFTSGDVQLKVGDSKYYKYEISSNTSIDRVKDMLKGIKEVKVTTNSGGVAVLNYHFFYDASSEVCGESICISTENFRKQLSYLKDNGYKTLTMQEFNDWMDGKITVPIKSVLITVDDGAMGTYNHLPQILNEYEMHATLFLISGWWPISRYQSSPYLEIQSHTHDLHHSDYCDANGCGYKTLKLSKDELKADLTNSINTIGTNLAFCYPFYQTNSNLVQAVKESGFKLGFVGGNKKATRSNNKYYIPRYVIYKNTSLSSFINMVS